jgi:hypothetical protein
MEPLEEAKRCGKCEQHEPEQEFYDLASWCKECMKEYARRRRRQLREARPKFTTAVREAFAPPAMRALRRRP